MKIICVILACVLLAACANDFETRRLEIDQTTYEVVEKDRPVKNGILYYESRLFVVTYSFSQKVDKDGNLTASSEKAGGLSPCKQVVQKEEIQSLPDYANPRVIINKPPQLSPGKFSVGLSNGVLTSVNAESTPNAPQLIQSLIKPFEIKVDSEPKGDACNSGPTITSVLPLKIFH